MSHQSTRWLISGFSREAYKKHITDDVILIITSYFDKSIKWIIAKRDFPNRTKIKLYSDTITIEGVEFKPYLSYQDCQRYTQMVFGVKVAFPNIAKKCSFQLITRCPTTNSKYAGLFDKEDPDNVHQKLTKKFVEQDWHCSLCNEINDKLSESCHVCLMKRQIPKDITNAMNYYSSDEHWMCSVDTFINHPADVICATDYSGKKPKDKLEAESCALRKNQYSKHDEITFIYEINMISVYDKDDQNITCKSIKILGVNDTLKFVWKINDELLQKFKACTFSRTGEIFYCDEYFGIGNNFCLSFIPDVGQLRVHLIALPANEKTLKFEWEMKAMDTGNDITKVLDHRISKVWVVENGKYTYNKFHPIITHDAIRKVSSLEFSVTLKRIKHQIKSIIPFSQSYHGNIFRV